MSKKTEPQAQTANLAILMDGLQYRFRNQKLLEKALRHRSCSSNNNERFEFLGDAILSFVITTELFKRFPLAQEGKLSRLRSTLVNEAALSKFGKQLQLDQFIQLGTGETHAGGAKRPSILSDSFEAIIGAIYLDSDIKTCYQVVLNWYISTLDALSLDKVYKDPKSILQELLQGKNLDLPKYELINSSGKDHLKVFQVACTTSLVKKPIIKKASSIRKAEQASAQAMLDEIHKESIS
jgi:ribonuclease-3